MANLRFQINSQNLDICGILCKLGYSSSQSELKSDKFYEFLKRISPDITR